MSVRLAAAKVTPIPVTCLEHGRWNQGFAFRASRKADDLLRTRMADWMADVAAAEQTWAASARGAARRGFAAIQRDVWREISAREVRAGAHSDTGRDGEGLLRRELTGRSRGDPARGVWVAMSILRIALLRRAAPKGHHEPSG